MKFESFLFKFSLTLSLGLLLFTKYAFAEPPKPPKVPVFPLTQAIDELLARNPVLLAARSEAVARSAEIEPAAALEDPMVSFELEDYPSSGNSPRTSAEAGNKIAFTQKIPYLGMRSAKRELAQRMSEAALSEARVESIQAVSELKRSYFKLSLAHALHDLLEQRLSVVRGSLSSAHTNFALGKLQQVDLLTLQAEEAAIETQIATSKEQLIISRAAVDHLLGRDSNQPWIPAQLKLTKINFSDFSETELVHRALEFSPKLNALKSLRAAATANVKVADLGFYPEFEVSVGYTARSSSGLDAGEDSLSAGVGLSIPLWSESKQKHKVAQANAEANKAEAILIGEYNAIVHSVHTKLETLKQSVARIGLAKHSLLPTSDAAINSAQRAYETGAVPILMVLALLKNRYEAEGQYLQAVEEHEGVVAELEAILGIELRELHMESSAK